MRKSGSGFFLDRLGTLSSVERAAAIGGFAAGRSALQRRIVAALIMETEAGPLSVDVVESPGSLSLPKGG